jgi:ribose-phosphate pyrophosphokinase
MDSIIFAFPGNESLAESLRKKLNSEQGDFEIRNFPDGESYVRIDSKVRNKKVILVCTLDHPYSKFLPLFFLAKTAKSLGAASIILIAPYLSYMRQDKRFKPGEGVTSEYFALLISQLADVLLTIDPHLHRRTSLSEIYSIKTIVLHSMKLIAEWIKKNIPKPVLIGPDMESGQWVSEVAIMANAPFAILEKVRRGDKEVKVSIPHLERYSDHTPVLVDDIISTARTMIETIGHLKDNGMKPPVCIGVHGIFAGNAYADLLATGVTKIVTTNSIPHVTNNIDINDLFFEPLKGLNTSL